MEVILFFASVLAIVGMLCWTTIAVTKKIIAYKTLRIQVENASGGPKISLEEAPMASIDHSQDEGNA